MLLAVPLPHELQHAGNDDGRRDRAKNSSQDCTVQQGQAKKRRTQQDNAQNFEGSWDKAHQQSRPPDFSQVLQIQRQAGSSQNDNQGQLTQIRRNSQDRWIQQIQGIGP
ncbi:hypothetical protein SDC9_192061 [bioreactor metagenome]|uniref:Uncharacterized protein n=1 Tax=bioreactor metagenome TaxID=1076179 RepID=A0A645I0X1_9ZZZZ